MTKWFPASRLSAVKRAFARQRTAVRLWESREKSIIELGHLTHRKIGAGQIKDPELEKASQAIDGWDRLLGQALEQRGPDAVPARPTAEADAARRPPDTGDADAPASGGAGAQGRPVADGARPFLRHGLFGALLSVMLALALCLALSTIANSALNQAVDSAKQAVADKVQGKLEAAKPDRLRGQAGVRISDQVRTLAEDKWSALARFQEASDFKLLDVPTAYLLVHNVQSKAHLRLGNDLVTSEMRFQIGLYAGLLIPLLAFLLGGYASARRMRIDSVKQAARLSLVIGAANALWSGLLAQMSGFSTFLALPRGIGSVEADFGFSLASAMLNGFALGAAFSLSGALLRLGGLKWAKRLRGEALPYGEPIRLAAAMIVRGVCLCLVYALALLGAKGALTTVLVVLLPQLAIYGWGVANGNLFQMTNFLAGQGKQVEISVFTGIQGAAMGGGAGEWHLYVLLSALIPVALLLYAGMRMKPELGDPRRQTMVFGAAYALLMSLLAMLTRIGMTVRGQAAFVDVQSFTLEAGFSVLGTFATCFILAYVCATLGAKVGARYRQRRRTAVSG